ncbi:polyprenyl synthetase family protein, partial [Streptomyces sp. SID14478]|nr:polyprenyl synthetase family protein [Streptomyces sp. SID14478]
AALYGPPGPGKEGAAELEAIALAVERAGGRDWAQARAADEMSRALHQLAQAVPVPEAAGGLLSLAEFVTRRGH